MRLRLLIILSLLTVPVVPATSAWLQIVDSAGINSTGNEEAGPGLTADLSEIVSNGFDRFSKDNYPYQLGAFRLKTNAEALFRLAKKYIDKDAILIDEDGYYKVRVTKLPDNPEYAQEKQEQEPPQPDPDEEPAAAIDTVAAVAANDSVPVAAAIAEVSVKAQEAVRNILFINGNSPWLRKITYLGKSMALVNALIFTITLCLATMIVLLMAILLNRRRLEKEEKLLQYLREKYQGLIIDYLFGNANPDEFKPIASDTYRRQVLIDQMIDVSENLKGDDEEKLIYLYKYLGLDRDSVNRAHDRRWHKKIKGFRELAFMNIKDANSAIYKALNSRNEILRMEAQIALVRLSDDNHFRFLSSLSRPFSLWEQITLHELIIQHSIPVPAFSQWLTSSNPTVVMFSLRMIREFKQKDAEEGVRAVLDHQSPVVKQLAVQVAGDLDMRSTLEPMKRMYKNQEYKVCLEIIRSMGKMPDPSMMGFLKLVLDKEDDVQLQIEATKAIENNGEEGVKALVKLMKSEYKNYNIIVRHVLDRRIF